MDNFIDHIEIRNFKSIRHLEVGGFKRINLFLGRPNVGKSNLLEALSVFGLPYLWKGSKKLTDLVRLTNTRELFFDGDFRETISLKLTKKKFTGISCQISHEKETGNLISNFIPVFLVDKFRFLGQDMTLPINNKLQLTKFKKSRLGIYTDVKPYFFNLTNRTNANSIYPFLQPPFGSNLLEILELMPELRQTYAQWFGQYGLQLVLDAASQTVKIQKQKSEFEVFQLPYSSIADTLQRIIFYKTAVASNENSVLLFEEPEAHAYPPYITEFTQEVIRSLTNQFFIVTHSPLIVEEFLSKESIDDLGIFMVDFKDGQTAVRPLTTEEIYEVRRYGIDLFFNNEAYLS